MGGWGHGSVGLPRLEPTAPLAARGLTRLGLILLPLAGLLILLELIGGLRGTVHFLSVSGISAKRRRWETAYYLIGGLVGPLLAGLVLLDFLRSGMPWRK